MRTALTIAVLLGLLGTSAGVALWAWREIGDVEMSAHGLVALTLGVLVTFALGAGLMALAFFSSRRGYDDRAHQPDDPPKEQRNPGTANAPGRQERP
jgi:multisubunit Na+/H+ antiporter MnhG subunit